MNWHSTGPEYLILGQRQVHFPKDGNKAGAVI